MNPSTVNPSIQSLAQISCFSPLCFPGRHNSFDMHILHNATPNCLDLRCAAPFQNSCSAILKRTATQPRTFRWSCKQNDHGVKATKRGRCRSAQAASQEAATSDSRLPVTVRLHQKAHASDLRMIISTASSSHAFYEAASSGWPIQKQCEHCIMLDKC